MNIKDVIDKITYDALTILIPEKQTIMMYRVSKEIRTYLQSVKLGIHVKISNICNKFPDISILLHKLEELNKNISIRSISFTGYHFEGVTGEAIIKELFNDRHCTVSEGDSRASLYKAGCTMTSLDFSYNNLDALAKRAFAKALDTNTTLKDLKLRNIKLVESGGHEIVDALRNNKTITSLDIGCNNLEASKWEGEWNNLDEDIDEEYDKYGVFAIIEEYAIAIANMIKENTTIVKLNLERNCLGEIGIDVIADALRVNTTITNLNLSRNNLEEYGTQKIVDALYMNTTITKLNLSSNLLGEDGALVIAEALYVITTLRSLNLSHNYLRRNSLCSEIGIIAIANALCKNKSITELDLEHNKIGLNGARELSKVLCVNDTLKILSLEHNKLGEKAAREIGKTLGVNTTLKVLNLSDNKLDKYGVHEIVDALRNNNTLTLLNIGCNDIGENEKKRVRDALRENHILTELII
jgi:Ran GTPase-activating protein (RanGAP) involved in mRNA processing and transport